MTQFVKPGNPLEDMVLQQLNRIEELEQLLDSLKKDVQKGLFHTRPTGVVTATEQSVKYFVRLFILEEAWSEEVGNPNSEDAHDGPLVHRVFQLIQAVSGDTTISFDYVTHLYFEHNWAMRAHERSYDEKISIRVPVR